MVGLLVWLLVLSDRGIRKLENWVICKGGTWKTEKGTWCLSYPEISLHKPKEGNIKVANLIKA